MSIIGSQVGVRSENIGDDNRFSQHLILCYRHRSIPLVHISYQQRFCSTDQTKWKKKKRPQIDLTEKVQRINWTRLSEFKSMHIHERDKKAQSE